MKVHIPTPAQFDFVECVNSHGWRQLAPFSWDAETQTLERVDEFGDGNAVLLSLGASDGSLEVTVSAEVDHAEVTRRVRAMFQLDRPMEAFHRYCADREELAHIPISRQGWMLRSPSLFEDVCKVLATTNTTWTQTKAMVARIVGAFGTPLVGDPSRRAFPRPEQIAAVSLAEFADKARMGYRNGSVYRIATDVASGALDLESWLDPSILSTELYKRLLSLPGVGPYAASCLLIYSGRYDRVNVDSWARMMVGKELGRAVSDKEVHDFFEAYGEWKALVYHFYKWREASS